jgi:hypothetical protein
MKFLVAFAATATLVFSGCATPSSDDGVVGAGEEQALSHATPDWRDCPEQGWTRMDTWYGLGGFYLRPDAAPTGELSMLKVLEDPSPFNGDHPGFVRTVDGYDQTGRLSLPAGPSIEFRDDAGHLLDTYTPLAFRRGPIAGDIVAICLFKTGDPGNAVAAGRPFAVRKF